MRLWIKTSLQTSLQIPLNGSLLFGTDEISFAINLPGWRSEQLVRKVHTLAIETKICISLNWLKSLSKFIRVCHSLSCFRSTTFTIIRFQCGFSGKSVFSGINHAGESYVCIYFFTRYPLSMLHSFPKKNVLRYYISHVILCSWTMLSQMACIELLCNEMLESVQ